MIIERIKFENFRQYKGEQYIEFSTDKEKNVTVLIGKNTSGKTTIIRAFNWCLYHKNDFRSKDLLNIEVERSLGINSVAEVSVEIELSHENRKYFIKRTQEYYRNDNNRIASRRADFRIQYKEINGETQSVPTANEGMYLIETVNKILPASLADYFFFDGERISEISNRGDLVSAVKVLMGLDVISTAKDLLDPAKSNSVYSKLNGSLDVGGDLNIIKLKREVEELQTENDSLKERIANTEKEITFCLSEKERLTELLLSNKEVKNNQQKKREIEKDIENIKQNINFTEEKLKSDFNRGAFNFFASAIIKKALNAIDNSSQNVEGIPHMRVAAIDHIVKRGFCICGLPLTNNDQALSNINHEKSLLPPQHIGTIINNQKKAMSKVLQEANQFYDIISNDFISYRNNVNEFGLKKESLDNISKKISGNLDAEKIEFEYQKNEQRLSDKQKLKNGLLVQIGINENNISNRESQISSYAVTSEKNKKIVKSLVYTKEIFKWFKESFEKQESIVKNQLLESVNKTFNKMYHGQRTVTMDDRYQIHLGTSVGGDSLTTDESRGLEAVKNFSFIAGIVSLAREKVREKNILDTDDAVLFTEPYPLVMDAPFSSLDEIHIKNVSQILPEAAEQVILIVKKNDWEFAADSLNNKIGAEYLIEKVNNSDTYSVIRRQTNV